MKDNRKQVLDYGQSLMEYSVAGLLVAGVAVGSLMTLSSSLSDNSPDIVAQMFNTNNPTISQYDTFLIAAPYALPSGGDPNNLNDYFVRPPSGNEAAVCLDGGFCVNAPTSGSPTEALSSNGSQSMMPNLSQSIEILEQLADQIEAAGDPVLAGLIRDHANDGHDVGYHTSLPYIENLGSQVALAGLNTDYVDTFNGSQDALFDYLLNNPNSVPPSVTNLIMAESTNIGTLDQYFRDTVYDLVMNSGQSQQQQQQQPQQQTGGQQGTQQPPTNGANQQQGQTQTAQFDLPGFLTNLQDTTSAEVHDSANAICNTQPSESCQVLTN